MKLKALSFIIPAVFIFASVLQGQPDTVTYQWPVHPLNENQGLTATFCEFRNTGSADHFHNAVDISEPDGNPVFPGISGIVHSIVPDIGSNSYVRIRSNINGQWKHITYLHIVPNPTLSVGQSVTAGETIIGTIYSGMGHVHLIERELVNSSSSNGTVINNVRESGGLRPYSDTNAPVIHSGTLKFYINNSNFELPSYGLSGKVDIKIKIEERNGTRSIERNNGTYLAGYRVWDEDTTNIVYEPFGNGVAYRFDREPVDADVHKVFVKGEATLSNPLYWLTNGEGADVINSSLRVRDNYWDTDLLPEGNYVLEIFTEDTRRNFTNKYFSVTVSEIDLVPPQRPVLLGVLNPDKNKSAEVHWASNSDPDIKGYRLYYSVNTQLSNWALAADESMLNDSINSYYFQSPDDFIEPASNNIYFFYMTAVDTIGNESEASDIYSRSSYRYGSGYPQALIVDGFDRYGGSGSWEHPVHSFNTDYFIPVTITDSIVISSAANEAVLNDIITLDKYDMVIWFTGDESTSDHTFSSAEQGRIAGYLENGGNLFVSGSEIGWDLERSHSGSELSDTLFYRHYLKARYVYDGSSSMNVVRGVSGSSFENVNLNLGQKYEEDWPDDIDPAYGSSVILNYNENRNGTTPRNAGVAFSGLFRNGSKEGKVIYLSFALETVFSLASRAELISEVLNYFDLDSTTGTDETEFLPTQFTVSQNYPNPFNPSTNFRVSVPARSRLTVKIYDVLGRLVDDIFDSELNPGSYTYEWNASGFASGIYFLRVITTDMANGTVRLSETKRMVLLK